VSQECIIKWFRLEEVDRASETSATASKLNTVLSSTNTEWPWKSGI